MNISDKFLMELRKMNTPEPGDRSETRREGDERGPKENIHRTEEPTPGDRADETHQPGRKEIGRRINPERTEMGRNKPRYMRVEPTGQWTPTIPPQDMAEREDEARRETK